MPGCAGFGGIYQKEVSEIIISGRDDHMAIRPEENAFTLHMMDDPRARFINDDHLTAKRIMMGAGRVFYRDDFLV